MKDSTVVNSTMLSVSDELVCLTGIDAVAVTGVAFAEDSIVADMSQRLDLDFHVSLLHKSQSLMQIKYNLHVVLSLWGLVRQIIQDFGEEGAQGRFFAYATFSDGLVMDVTHETIFSSTKPDYIQVQSNTDTEEIPTAVITAKVASTQVFLIVHGHPSHMFLGG